MRYLLLLTACTMLTAGCQGPKHSSPVAPDPYAVAGSDTPLGAQHATPYGLNPQLNLVDNVLIMRAYPPFAKVPMGKVVAQAETRPVLGLPPLWKADNLGVAQTVSTTLSAPRGFTPGGAAAMGIAGLVLTAPTNDIRQAPFIIGWLPKTEASNSEAAFRRFREAVINYYRSLSAKGLLYPIAAESALDSYPDAPSNVARNPEPNYAMPMRDPAFPQTLAPHNLIFDDQTIAVSEGFAPSALGGYPCYVIVLRGGMFSYDVSNLDRLSEKTDIANLQKIAAETPRWMALYLAHKGITHIDQGQRRPVGLPGVIFDGQFSLYQ